MERRYPQPRPIVIDFFCGAGGMSLGFEQAGFDVVLGVDVDGYHTATHERNFPYGKAICGSIVDLDADKIRRSIETDRDIDVVVGGPPCQGFSHMGLRDLKDPRNSLIDHYVRLVLELRPKAFVMENVPGMLSGETRAILEAVIETSRKSGYNITLPVRVLDAAAFGVPQQRRRLFLLGLREDIGGEIAYPSGKCECQPDRPTVLEAIADLPVIERYDALFRENDVRYTKKPKSRYAQVARGSTGDPSDLSRPRDWDTAICSGCLRTRHAPKSVALYRATPPGETVPGHKLPRLHPAGICPTLRAGSDSTHGSYTAPRPIHPQYPRCITSREAARLHGFPDWFAFYPLKWHAYRQIGNAVCPPVARALGYTIRSVLRGRTTERNPPSIRLGDEFTLPENRPRSLKRIPQIKQFPPVIAFLFAKAFDVSRRRLRRASFTFDDVQRAIQATGVNLHWTRKDTFLSEIARSRRVNEMLAPALSQGYSIIPFKEDGAIGRFVPAGTPGTLDDKEVTQIRIDEIHGADRLPLSSFDLNGCGWGVVAVFSQEIVQDAFWGSREHVIGLANGEAKAETSSGVFTVTLRQPPHFAVKSLPVVTCKAKALPSKSRIAKIGEQQQSDTVAVLVAATSRHLVALRFDNCLSNPKETLRRAFEVG